MPTLYECVRARKVFLQEYRKAAQFNGKELSIKIALSAVWMAGREYERTAQGEWK